MRRATLHITRDQSLIVGASSTLINDGTLVLDIHANQATQLLFDCDGNGQNPGTVVNNATLELNNGSNVARDPFGGCGATVPVVTNNAGATIETLSGGNFTYVQVAIDNLGTVDTRSVRPCSRPTRRVSRSPGTGPP